MTELQIKDNKIFCPLKNEWHILTPEEKVRQKYIQVLVNDYGYKLEQMEQEVKVSNSDRGNGRASADIIVWINEEDRKAKKKPLIVVECKSDNVVIRTKDYYQGMNYASWAGAKFFVTHNSKETKFFQVLDDVLPNLPDEILNIPTASATEKEIKQLLEETKAFSREEFTNLLKNCHNSIRNRDALDPASAFDEISKLLFIKINFERQDKYGKIFTKKYIEEQEENFEKIIKPSLVVNDPVKFNSMSYIQFMFESTKNNFREDKLFEDNERIKIKDSTFKDIVSKLEKYNLSKTGDDVKGIAFEKFLGQTFRGEIGQFFTPRSVVDFIVQFLEPKEGQKVIDPASGSGGFLIKFFQEILGQIEDDIQIKKDKKKEEIEKLNLSEEEKAKKLNEEFLVLNKDLEEREWKLATECIFGTDKNSRMARTSKMNMIMHGDGHGGVHHHDGLVNVKNIEEEMFDLVITNPPFGASVFNEDGEISILDKYELGKNRSAQKTEILFIERCLKLLKPGGRMGIVLPEGILNNPSLQYVREYLESKAKILAVVSLPVDTFKSAKASVKSSIIFLQKFIEEEKGKYQSLSKEINEKYNLEIKKVEKDFEERIKKADKQEKKVLKTELKSKKDELILQSKKEIKMAFNYPIFMVEVENSGITSTGESDPEGNELPIIIEEFRKFEKELFQYQKKNFNINVFLIEYANFEERWDTKAYAFLKIFGKTSFEFVKIGSLLKNSKERIDLEKEISYKQITIRIYHKGVILRGEQKGKDIKTKTQFKVKSGQFILSKIDAKDGAFGIIPDYLDGGVITGSFVSFDIINTNILDINYFDLLLAQDFFLNILKSKSVGTTGRKPIMIDEFLELKIPLPPLEIQEKIVKTYNDIKNEIESLEAENKNLDKEVDNYLMKELGIEIEQKEKKKFFCVGYEDFNYWSVGLNTIGGKNNILTKNIIDYFDINPITKINDNDDVSFVEMSSVNENGGYIANSEIVKFSTKKSGYTRFQKGDIIFARITPCTENGKVAIVKNIPTNFGTGSTEFYVLRPKKEINLDYFHQLFLSPWFRKQAISSMVGSTGRQRVPKVFLDSVKIPDLGIGKQDLIFEGINNIQNKNKLNQMRIEKLKVDLDEKIKGMILEGKFL